MMMSLIVSYTNIIYDLYTVIRVRRWLELNIKPYVRRGEHNQPTIEEDTWRHVAVAVMND